MHLDRFLRPSYVEVMVLNPSFFFFLALCYGCIGEIFWISRVQILQGQVMLSEFEVFYVAVNCQAQIIAFDLVITYCSKIYS